MDGCWYVFGILVYNYLQKDVIFVMGVIFYSGLLGGFLDYEGIIGYFFLSDVMVNNLWGIDYYYQVIEMFFYVYFFMLISVLSDDYLDVDGFQGFSIGDLGSYVKFDYMKVDEYKWCMLVEQNVVYYNEGFKVDVFDDKGSYVYGEKDLWYVKMVEIKNYVVVFELEDCYDVYLVLGEYGGLDVSYLEKVMKLLCKISLYICLEYEVYISDFFQVMLLQEVYFEYNYNFCQYFLGNLIGGGKLMLEWIWFLYQKFNKMVCRFYKFEYNGLNLDYVLKVCDCWGMYLLFMGMGVEYLNGVFINSDYLYMI